MCVCMHLCVCVCVCVAILSGPTHLITCSSSCQLSVLAQGNGLQVDCSSSSPHLTFSVALQQFLQQTCSLPLLLQVSLLSSSSSSSPSPLTYCVPLKGVCLTMDAAAELSSFVERTQDFQVSSPPPPPPPHPPPLPPPPPPPPPHHADCSVLSSSSLR